MSKLSLLFVYNNSKFLRDCSIALRDSYSVSVVNSLDGDRVESVSYDFIIAEYSTINHDSHFISLVKKNSANCRVVIVAEEMVKLDVSQFRAIDFQVFQMPISVREVVGYVSRHLTALQEYKNVYRAVVSSPYEIVQTLHGLISLVNPVAYNVGVQLDRFVSVIIKKLELDDRQEYHSAALLSHIGCIAVDQDVIIHSIRMEDGNDNWRHMYDVHPELGQKFLENIPMLRNVAQIVGQQNKRFSSYVDKDDRIVARGAQMLKVAAYMHANYFRDDLNQRMYNVLCEDLGIYNKKMLMVFVDYKITADDTFVTSLRLKELEPGMVLEEPVFNTYGLLLMAGGLELNMMSLQRLRKFADSIREPIKVRCSMKLSEEPAGSVN